jgi:HD-GYP domain-containing protein (c-di-GMP phosphodiesterase class II)
MIFGLAKLTESRDPDTGNHLERIARYSTRLAEALRRRPGYAERISPAFVRLIGISSALHDIGKVGISDSILLKPGTLDPEERSAMERHAVIGGQCLREIELKLGSSNYLEMAREIAFHHHERWDGKGYPDGLQGKEIPLAARIVAIADVYDALSTRRVYKEAFPHQECVEIISEQAGGQFDPALVEVFLRIQEEYEEIALRYADATWARIRKRTAEEEEPKAESAAAAGGDKAPSFPIVVTEQNTEGSHLSIPDSWGRT